MANQWFRLYAEFANDPKVQMLSESDQRRFVMLLCLRCSNDDVTLQDEELAFQLRISNEEWLITKATLIAKNLINDDAQPVAWDRRQFQSDSSAARVAKHRRRKKQECNVTVTPPDTDTDTDTEITPPTPSRGVSVDDGFAKFWEAYPRKAGKRDALKAWTKIKPDESLEVTILAAVRRQAQSDGWRKDGGQFVPYPATYLRGERWLDELKQTPAVATVRNARMVLQ
mgnify:CR=1 FL=1